jgi:hypothetical protein
MSAAVGVLNDTNRLLPEGELRKGRIRWNCCTLPVSVIDLFLPLRFPSVC